MRIRSSHTDQVAKKDILVGAARAFYHVWPYDRPRDAEGKKSRENKNAVSFDTVEGAASHLFTNLRDQIRMQPRHALINWHVIFETDIEKPEPHNA